MKTILVDENMSRIFSPKWRKVASELKTMGYHLVSMPQRYLGVGYSDKDIAEMVIKDYDGILTEDTDFFETHRSNLLNRLVSAGKEVLVVRRVNPNDPYGEVRVYRYTLFGKEELFRVVINY